MFDFNSRVLVIDDMLTMRKIVSKNLREIGFTNIVEASDGVNGWEVIEDAANKGAPIQLVLSDWNMPHLSGIDLLKKVRADPRHKDLPFILITAESEKQQVVQAVTLQVTQYIIKPFTKEMIQDKLESGHQKVLALQKAAGAKS